MTKIHSKYESTPPKSDSGDLTTGNTAPDDDYITQLNHLTDDSGVEGAGGDDEGITSDGFEPGDAYQGPNVTRETILDLFHIVEDGKVKPTDGSITQEKALEILRQALRDEAAGNDNASSSEYAEIVNALGGAEAIDPLHIAEAKFGEAPTKIENDTYYFDGKGADGNGDGEGSFDLKAPGENAQVVITNAQEVNLTPKDTSDLVTVTLSGNKYVIKMGNDTFKINKDANIQIVSDHVTGTVDSKDSHISIGASESTSTTLGNQNATADLGNKLAGAAGKIGYVTYTMDQDGSVSPSGSFTFGLGGINLNAHADGFTYGVGWHGAQTIKAGSSDQSSLEAQQAKDVINAMADAAKEKDPAKQKDKWDHAFDVLSRVKSENSEPGYVNNIGQLIFDTLFGELEEDGLKNALQQGIIPNNFANKLGELLTAKDEENNDKAGEITGYQIGGPGWTHKTSAEFLKNKAGSGDSGGSSGS